MTGQQVFDNPEKFVLRHPHHIEPDAVYNEEAIKVSLGITDVRDLDALLDGCCSVLLPSKSRLYIGMDLMAWLREQSTEPHKGVTDVDKTKRADPEGAAGSPDGSDAGGTSVAKEAKARVKASVDQASDS